MTPLYRKAIQSIESSGGNYDLLGPVTRNGDRAYGAYQVMGNNIPEWTTKHLGRAYTPDEFLADKDAQDKVFDAQFGSYVNKYGNPQDAASAWFTGGPRSTGANKRDVLGTSGSSYVDKFDRYVNNNGGDDGVSAINSAAGIKNAPPGALTSSYAEPESKKSMPALSADNVLGDGVLASQPATTTGSGDKWADALSGIGASLAGISNPEQAKAINEGLKLRQKQATDKGTWSSHITPNGQVLQTHSITGAVRPLTDQSGKPISYAKPEEDTYDTEAKKASAKSNQELGDQINQNARDASAQGQTVSELRAAFSDPNLKQGVDGPARQFLNKMYTTMGFGDAATAAAAANGDIASALSNKLALQLVNSGGVKLLPGSFSDSDRKFVQQMATSLSNDPVANQRLLDIYERSNKYVQQAEELRSKHVDANDGIVRHGFRKELSDLSARQLEEAKAEAAARPAAPQAAPAASPTAAPKSFKTKSGVSYSY